MKKMSAVLILVVMFFVSCVSTRNIAPVSKSEKDVSVSVDGVVQKSYPYLWCIFVPFTYLTSRGVVAHVENTGKNPVTIDWSKSSISYNGHTSNVFISGQKYITANSTAVPPLTIPPSGNTSLEIYPADLVYWDDNNWDIASMGLHDGNEIIVTLAANADGKDGFIVIRFGIDKGDGFYLGI